jgi:hypothetical protein
VAEVFKLVQLLMQPVKILFPAYVFPFNIASVRQPMAVKTFLVGEIRSGEASNKPFSKLDSTLSEAL